MLEDLKILLIVFVVGWYVFYVNTTLAWHEQRLLIQKLRADHIEQILKIRPKKVRLSFPAPH